MLFFGAPYALSTTAALVGVSVGGASLVAGYAFSSLIVHMLKGAIYGAIYGAMGAYALTALGFGACAILPVAAVGALAGVAFLVPLSFVAGLSWIFPGNDNSQDDTSDDELGALTAIAGFSLRIGIIFLSSLLVSTTVLLGSMPAAAIATGAAITELAIEAGKSVLGLGA